MLIPIR
jgi:hypothetical protein